MKYNNGKSKYMMMMESREEAEVLVWGKEMKNVDSFKYVGSVIQEDGRFDMEVNERWRQAGEK